MAAEGPPGRGQVVAHVAEAAVGGLEPLLGEAPLRLDLVELPGGVVQRRLRLLRRLLAVARSSAPPGTATPMTSAAIRSPAAVRGTLHVSPPWGTRIEKTAGASGMGGTERRQRTIAQPRPPVKPQPVDNSGPAAGAGADDRPSAGGDAGDRGRGGGGFAAAARRAVLWPSAGGRSRWRATGAWSAPYQSGGASKLSAPFVTVLP